MNIKELIASGKLELFVSGTLPPQEMAEIAAIMEENEEVQKEVEAIEAALQQLSQELAPESSFEWKGLAAESDGVRALQKPPKRRNWMALSGWAAAILCLVGLFWMISKINALKEEFRVTTDNNSQLERSIEEATKELNRLNEVLAALGSPDYKSIDLPGNQDVAPEAFARVYYDSEKLIAYIDTRGLPETPEGKVYQAWSLKLDPLSPSSMGVLDQESEIVEWIFKLEGFPEAEAFGITLEPEGGSESPSLEQLYTLGTVAP